MFYFNYFLPTCLLAPSEYCEPPSTCAQPNTLPASRLAAYLPQPQSRHLNPWVLQPSRIEEGRFILFYIHFAWKQPAHPSFLMDLKDPVNQGQIWPRLGHTHLKMYSNGEIPKRRRNGSLRWLRDPFLMGQDHRSPFCTVVCCSTPLFHGLDKWKHTRRVQHVLSKLLYFTNLFQPPSQLFPCQQLHHHDIPLPTHKCTGWRYELESLR